MKNWQEAKERLRCAVEYFGLIGKPQRTTHNAVGVLHSVKVETQIHHQETDGAKNYHSSAHFDAALSEVIRCRFPELAAEAISELEAQVSATGKLARADVQRMLKEIDEYEQTTNADAA